MFFNAPRIVYLPIIVSCDYILQCGCSVLNSVGPIYNRQAYCSWIICTCYYMVTNVAENLYHDIMVFKDFAQLNVFQCTQDCLLTHVSCDDILQCGCLVLNWVGAIMDKLVVAELFVPVIIWLLIARHFVSQTLMFNSLSIQGKHFISL